MTHKKIKLFIIQTIPKIKIPITSLSHSRIKKIKTFIIVKKLSKL